MGTLFLIIGVVVATHPPSATGGIKKAGIAAIIMVYFEAASYNMSWGPVSWLYMGEIFPTRIREPGIAIATATQWLFNFVFSQVTPHAIANIGWRTFLMFCIFNYFLVVYAYLFFRETKGISLEEMEGVWGSAETQFDVEAVRAKAQQMEREEAAERNKRGNVEVS